MLGAGPLRLQEQSAPALIQAFQRHIDLMLISCQNESFACQCHGARDVPSVCLHWDRSRFDVRPETPFRNPVNHCLTMPSKHCIRQVSKDSGGQICFRKHQHRGIPPEIHFCLKLFGNSTDIAELAPGAVPPAGGTSWVWRIQVWSPVLNFQPGRNGMTVMILSWKYHNWTCQSFKFHCNVAFHIGSLGSEGSAGQRCSEHVGRWAPPNFPECKGICKWNMMCDSKTCRIPFTIL